MSRRAQHEQMCHDALASRDLAWVGMKRMLAIQQTFQPHCPGVYVHLPPITSAQVWQHPHVYKATACCMWCTECNMQAYLQSNSCLHFLESGRNPDHHGTGGWGPDNPGELPLGARGQLAGGGELHAWAHSGLVGECHPRCTVLGQLVAALQAEQRLQTCITPLHMSKVPLYLLSPCDSNRAGRNSPHDCTA